MKFRLLLRDHKYKITPTDSNWVSFILAHVSKTRGSISRHCGRPVLLFGTQKTFKHILVVFIDKRIATFRQRVSKKKTHHGRTVHRAPGHVLLALEGLLGAVGQRRHGLAAIDRGKVGLAGRLLERRQRRLEEQAALVAVGVVLVVVLEAQRQLGLLVRRAGLVRCLHNAGDPGHLSGQIWKNSWVISVYWVWSEMFKESCSSVGYDLRNSLFFFLYFLPGRLHVIMFLSPS